MSRLQVSAQSIVLVPATPISSESKRGVSSKHSFLCAPFVAPQPHIPLSISFHQIQTIGTIIAMSTAAPQILDLMNTLANASGPHVEEIIKALKALPQCIKASAEATKMSTITKVAKKERAKQGKGKGPKRPLNSWMAYRSMLLQTLSPFFWILLTLLRVLQPNA
jgi:hypothetical protein